MSERKIYTRLIQLSCCVSMLIATNSLAVDQTVAEKLHNQHCMKCHDTSVYQRPERFIKSYKMLDQQIKRCEVPAGVKWSPSQITEVTDYLNSHFYKFDKPK